MVDLERLTVVELLDAVAARTPVPGGGAVAALTAALAAALGRMVVEYSKGKPSSAGHETLHGESLETLARLQSGAVGLAAADAAAFLRLSSLWKLDRNDQRRRAEWTDAVAGAIDAPRQVIETSLETLELLARLSATTSSKLRSDLAISALLAQAGAEAAACNVRINLPLVEDQAAARQLEGETAAALDRARDLRASIDRACGD